VEINLVAKRSKQEQGTSFRKAPDRYRKPTHCIVGCSLAFGGFLEKTCEHHVNARVISSTEERERHCSDVDLREKHFALVADTKFGTECAQKDENENRGIGWSRYEARANKIS
jgi:hypothetical protein